MNKNKVIITLFLGGLYLTTLASLIKPDDIFSPKEKRYLAQKPDFSADTLFSGKFGEDYELYLNDQFPMREQIASLHTVCERLLGKKEISGIYFGDSDYFIEHHEKKDYDTELAQKNETAVSTFLTEMSKQLGEDRVRFLAVPSAETVLTGYLPSGAPASAEHEVLNRYKQQLALNGNEKLLVPVKDALIQKGKNSSDENPQLYYRTDHHWTIEGAFIGYHAWADSLGMTPRPETDFSQEILKDDFYGTIAARVNSEVIPDSLKAMIPKFDVRYKVKYQGSEAVSDSLYDKTMLDSPEPYAVYLKGNQPLTRIRTSGISKEMEKRKLLVIKDSFGNSLVPFLVNHYEETLVVDLRYLNQSLSELIKNEQVTDICVVFNPAQMSKETALYKINR